MGNKARVLGGLSVVAAPIAIGIGDQFRMAAEHNNDLAITAGDDLVAETTRQLASINANFGLFQTFRSYGVSEEDLVRADESANIDLIDALGKHVPDEHHQFVRKLEPVIEEDDFFVLHAKWGVDRPSESPPIAAQLADSMKLRETVVWERFEE